jgi:hypothetical protein
MVAALDGIGDIADFALDEAVQVEMGKIEELLPRALVVEAAGPVGKQRRVKIAADPSAAGAENKIAGGDPLGDQQKEPGPENPGGLNEVSVKNRLHRKIFRNPMAQAADLPACRFILLQGLLTSFIVARQAQVLKKRAARFRLKLFPIVMTNENSADSRQ